MLTALQAMRADHDVIGDVRGRGAMVAIEFTEPTPDLTARIAKHCHRNGVLVLTAGTYGNVLRFLPPLSIPDELLTEALDVLRDAIAAESR
jgi:4-aminobutyrate aminotransferase/(S)-3-amino-2-methylpropionate transaminase